MELSQDQQDQWKTPPLGHSHLVTSLSGAFESDEPDLFYYERTFGPGLRRRKLHLHTSAHNSNKHYCGIDNSQN